MTTLVCAPANSLDNPNTEKNAALTATAPAAVATKYGNILEFTNSIYYKS